MANESSFKCELHWGMGTKQHEAPAIGFRVLGHSAYHIYACCADHAIFEADAWLYVSREQAAAIAVRLLTLANDLETP